MITHYYSAKPLELPCHNIATAQIWISAKR